MMGKTHYKLGILHYCILCLLLSVLFNPLIELDIDFISVIFVVLGSLMPDLDHYNSLIIKSTGIAKIAYKTIDKFYMFIERLIGFILCSGTGILLLFIYIYHYRKIYILTIGIIMIILGFFFSITSKLPIISNIIKLVDKHRKMAKTLFYKFLLIGFGSYLIFINQRLSNLVCGGIFLLVSLLPHRSFLHSPFGMLTVVYAMNTIAIKYNITHYVYPFSIGYFSHLYLGDMLTKSGVPLFGILPTIFFDVFRLSKSRHKILYNILDFKIKIPIMRTGSKGEKIYLFCTFIFCLALFYFTTVDIL